MNDDREILDVIVVGAGFGGLYMLHRLMQEGRDVRAYEAAPGVGGVWYWNRYPGAQCDIESIYYCFTFSEKIYRNWAWPRKYSSQGDILRYLNHVTDELDLRSSIQFNTAVQSARFDDATGRWTVGLSTGETVVAKYVVMATGALSTPNLPNITGLTDFSGELYHTGRWPDHDVRFEGKRVGVIGTGASGVQCIPCIAERASHLTVFQRTPQYSLPARNFDYAPDVMQAIQDRYHEIVGNMRSSHYGYPIPAVSNRPAMEDSSDQRQQTYNHIWNNALNGSVLLMIYNDIRSDPAANETAAAFVRGKIGEIVKDQETLRKLLPDYPIGGKRIPKDTNYFETYNRENVDLIDLRERPIVAVMPDGVDLGDQQVKLDMLICATGFDAFTGPPTSVDIVGRDGMTLKDKWLSPEGLKTYLGIATAGFPNLFFMSGPLGPGVTIVVPVLNEFVGDWIARCISRIEQDGKLFADATPAAEDEWVDVVDGLAAKSLLAQVDSWYNGSNIEGKKKKYLIYTGGFIKYKSICEDVIENGLAGFDVH